MEKGQHYFGMLGRDARFAGGVGDVEGVERLESITESIGVSSTPIQELGGADFKVVWRAIRPLAL